MLQPSSTPCYSHPASHATAIAANPATAIQHRMLQPSSKPCYSHPASHATAIQQTLLQPSSIACMSDKKVCRCAIRVGLGLWRLLAGRVNHLAVHGHCMLSPRTHRAAAALQPLQLPQPQASIQVQHFQAGAATEGGDGAHTHRPAQLQQPQRGAVGQSVNLVGGGDGGGEGVRRGSAHAPAHAALAAASTKCSRTKRQAGGGGMGEPPPPPSTMSLPPPTPHPHPTHPPPPVSLPASQLPTTPT